MLNSGIDAVIIANYANEHAPYAIKALDKGMPYTVPDMRDHAVRDLYRNNHYCTDPRTPAEYLLPTTKSGTPEVDESVYDAVREELSRVDLTPGMK